MSFARLVEGDEVRLPCSRRYHGRKGTGLSMPAYDGDISLARRSELSGD
jgi:hypothetical protein